MPDTMSTAVTLLLISHELTCLLCSQLLLPLAEPWGRGVLALAPRGGGGGARGGPALPPGGGGGGGGPALPAEGGGGTGSLTQT